MAYPEFRFGCEPASYNPEDYCQIQTKTQRVTTLNSYMNIKLVNYIEIFISNLPYNAYEEEILRHFLFFGPIWQLRLLVYRSGLSRGYGYLIYCDDDSARQALLRMHRFEIRPAWCINVTLSKNHRSLIFKNPRFRMTSTDIRDNILFTNPIQIAIGTIATLDNNRKRIILVKYSTYREADEAHRVFLSEMRFRLGRKARVAWYKGGTLLRFSLDDNYFFLN